MRVRDNSNQRTYVHFNINQASVTFFLHLWQRDSDQHKGVVYKMATNKRNVLNIQTKLNILSDLENKIPNCEVCKKYNLSKSTVSTVLKNKDKIRGSMHTNVSKLKKIRKPVRVDVDQALLKWFTIQRSQNMPVTGSILQTKAEELAKINPNGSEKQFVCTKGWLDRFKSRYNINAGKIHGESASVSIESTTEWLRSVWPEISNGYNENDIFNGDETGLFYKMTPDKTLKFKGEKCSGGKQSKDRITVWVCANMTGTEKRELTIIGKSKNPRCLKNCGQLPVNYVSNKRAWVTSEIFEKLLREWDAELRRKCRKIILIVDNCPAHPHVRNLQFIKLVFLPPNVTAVLQPMDQGVIRCLKSYYRKMFLVRLIGSLEKNEGFKFTILDAILMISASWRRVSQKTIENCFQHAGFATQLASEDEEDDIPLARWIVLHNNNDDEDSDEEERPLSTWIKENKINFNEFVSTDDSLVTTNIPSDKDLMAEASEPTSSVEVMDTDSEEDEEAGINSLYELPTLSHTLDSLNVVSHFLHHCNAGPNILAAYDKVYRFTENQAFFKNKVQNKITKFFYPQNNNM